MGGAHDDCEQPGPHEGPTFDAPFDTSTVLDALTAAEAQRLDFPHVVVVNDPVADAMSAFGPFDGPIEASAFADRFMAELTRGRCRDAATSLVIPLEGFDA